MGYSKDMDSTSERSRESVRRWYAAHRDEYNAKRRARYSKGAEVARKARQRAQDYRDSVRDGRGIERALYRVVDGAQVRLFTTGEIAEKLGCSAQMIRNWEAKGWIPPTVFPDSHRLYMAHQVALISKLYAKMSKSPYKKYKEAVVAQWMKSTQGKW